MTDLLPPLTQNNPATSPPNLVAQAQHFLQTHPNITLLIVQWVDISGITRYSLIPPQTALHLLQPGSYMNSAPLVMTISTTEALPPLVWNHFSGRGKGFLDGSTLRPMAHDRSSLGNCGWVVAEHDWLGLDARMNLRNVVDQARDGGVDFLVGFEVEFTLLKPGTLESIDIGDLGAGHTLQTEAWEVLNEMTVALAEGGVYVESLHKEYGTTQWEFSLPPYPPVESVDVLIYTREVIRNIAAKHGMVATLFPTPHADEVKSAHNGLHVHISATPTKEIPDWDPDTVMAGILSHIPELMAVFLPTTDSYARVGIGKMAAGGLLGWGFNHRDMPVRQVTRDHWEIRCVDGCANPYAVVAGLVAAAMDRKPLTVGNADSKLKCTLL